MGIILTKHNSKTVQKLAEHLLEKKIAIIPCDTIYGIVGIVPETETALREVKGREETKPFIQLITREMLSQITPMELESNILSYWPGPLTIIVTHRQGGTVAVREPADPFLQQVLTLVGRPLFSTSVNFSGEVAFTQFSEMVKRFDAAVPLFVEGDASQGTTPSTIIDATCSPYKLIRQGALQVDRILVNP
jgi:L-threonylcarbamoyladenylate synthase